MGGDRSAYAVLGLQPDADSEAVDRAYRLLIKIHHPDVTGGDASRAAEINRAYRELRGRSPALSDPLIIQDDEVARDGGASLLWAVLVTIVLATAALATAGWFGWFNWLPS